MLASLALPRRALPFRVCVIHCPPFLTLHFSLCVSARVCSGRIAADIECADELLLTEFLYEGHWTGLSSDELMSILTAWLDVEKSSASRLQIPTAPLQKAYGSLRELAQNISVVSNECGLVLDSSRYVSSFKSDLIPITYAWISGGAATFADLTAMSDLFEGTIIRLFRRLDEMVR